MNRFNDLLRAVKVGDSFGLTAKAIGMNAKEFDGFVDTILNTEQKDFSASHPHQDSDSAGDLYDGVVITRTA